MNNSNPGGQKEEQGIPAEELIRIVSNALDSCPKDAPEGVEAGRWKHGYIQGGKAEYLRAQKQLPEKREGPHARDIIRELLEEREEGEEDPDGHSLVICPDCGGDGKETCHNPDHGFIEAMPGETGRLGCPVCGHDDQHKVNRGKNVCPTCGGHGHICYDQAEDWAKENGYDEEFILYIPPSTPPLNHENKALYDLAEYGRTAEGKKEEEQ